MTNVITTTAAQVKTNPYSEYNPVSWNKIVEEYEALGGMFFIQKGKEFDKFFVVYNTTDRIRLFKELSFSSSMQRGGFAQVVFDGGNVTVKGFGNNGKSRIQNTAKGREYMAQCSKFMGTIFTNAF